MRNSIEESGLGIMLMIRGGAQPSLNHSLWLGKGGESGAVHVGNTMAKGAWWK